MATWPLVTHGNVVASTIKPPPFAAFTNALPDHRIYTDGMYRLGINQALGGNFSAAEETAQALDVFRREHADATASARAFAIRVVIASQQGDMAKARQLKNRVTFGRRDAGVIAHWGAFWAQLLMQEGEFRDAARAYQELMNSTQDPAQRAAVILGAGQALAADGQQQEAMLVLTQLDALPWGSPQQRTQARWLAGQIRFDVAQSLLTSDKEKTVEFAQAEQAEARRMIELVANSKADAPEAIAAAQAWVAANPAPEDEAVEDSAEGEDVAETATP